MVDESPYARFGGHQFFDDLVSGFYRRVSTDPILRPMYPEADLEPAAQRLLMFLEQYWGGPTTYSQLRGHPRLRMRHAPFRIDAAAHDAWLAAMSDALTDAADRHDLAPEDRAQLWDYFTHAAHSMVNTFPADPRGTAAASQAPPSFTGVVTHVGTPTGSPSPQD